LDGPRRNWLLARLTQIGAVYGVRQALHLRDWRLRTSSSAKTPVIEVTPSSAPAAVAKGKGMDIDPAEPVDRDPLDSPRELWFPEL
jgi:hypothetical protein